MTRPLPEERFVSLMMSCDEDETIIRESVARARMTGCSIPGKDLTTFLSDEAGLTIDDLPSLYGKTFAR